MVRGEPLRPLIYTTEVNANGACACLEANPFFWAGKNERGFYQHTTSELYGSCATDTTDRRNTLSPRSPLAGGQDGIAYWDHV